MNRQRIGSLSGWWRYLPLIAVPFGIVFAEVWHQTQILNNEYHKNELRASIRQTQAQIEELEDRIHELARMERVLQRAPDLGLVPPHPGQVVEVAWTPPSNDASNPTIAAEQMATAETWRE